ncbi:MAG: hypothetical protein H6Q99_4235, partial [Proteobacteria bacterium]|nr:hypothetical protein [Pseudomonadota bacterium]
FDLTADDVSHVRPGEAPSADAAVVVEEAVETEDLPVPLPSARRRFSWSRLFFGAVTGILSLAIGLWLDQLVRELFARDDWLGWLAIALIALAGIAVIAIAAREIAGLIWLRRIDRLRRRADLAAVRDDRPEAEAIVGELMTLYADRSDLAPGRRATEARVDDVIDGRDRLVLAEADLLAPLDAAARRLVSDAAARVSVVTAVSPRAAVDVIFVVVATLGLIRRLAALYGGRPGFMGMARLTRTDRPWSCRQAVGAAWRGGDQRSADSACGRGGHRRLSPAAVPRTPAAADLGNHGRYPRSTGVLTPD